MSLIKSTCAVVLMTGFSSLTTAPLARANPSAEYLGAARKICEGLTGVVCDANVLGIMSSFISQKAPLQAALAAIDYNDNFYKKLRNQIHRLSNEDRTPRGPLNSFTALVVGMTRDRVPFDQVLYGDIIYTAEGVSDPARVRPFHVARNDHFEDAEKTGGDLKDILVRRSQSELGMFPPNIASGVLTTPTFGQAYFLGGTNRAVLANTYEAFLCHSIEQMHDNTRPKSYIAKDVTYAPGGDPAMYINNCSGCHAGMDAQRPAFWGWDYVERVGLQYDPTRRLDKLVRNATENPHGFEIKDNTWKNLWVEGKNASLGWSGPTEGRGLKAWGQMLSQTNAFAKCWAKRALVGTCLVDPETSKSQSAINQLANQFMSEGRYDMKLLYANASLMCGR